MDVGCLTSWLLQFSGICVSTLFLKIKYLNSSLLTKPLIVIIQNYNGTGIYQLQYDYSTDVFAFTLKYYFFILFFQIIFYVVCVALQ